MDSKKKRPMKFRAEDIKREIPSTPLPLKLNDSWRNEQIMRLWAKLSHSKASFSFLIYTQEAPQQKGLQVSIDQLEDDLRADTYVP